MLLAAHSPSLAPRARDRARQSPLQCALQSDKGVARITIATANEGLIMTTVHQELLRESLAATGHVETACLIRVKSGAVKAVSPGFEVMIKHKTHHCLLYIHPFTAL